MPVHHNSADLPDGAYTQAGVSLDAAQRAKQLMAAAVRSTYGPEVLAGIGAFGGMFSAARLKDMAEPVLVASTDGVGTKTKVAARMGRWDTIGHDLVNHCVNDILAQGARPLFMLDYVAAARLEPEQIATIVAGVAEACRAAGCALIGGETAQMPGVYEAGEIDLVGTIIGVVDRAQIVDGTHIRPGDAILGLPSTGLHTNGYSLARQALADLDWAVSLPELGCSPAEALLAPHRAYLEPIERLRAAGVVLRGLAHITGGGFTENLPRILPAGCGAELRRGTWPEPPIFDLIQRRGEVEPAEMFDIFNMGLGMLVIVAPEDVARAQAALSGEAHLVGEVVAGKGQVTVDNL
ncbi:MAG TPA: phosphoribosylformylglycinamidine cyclo-ligase [Roseiflexaceae bacterium]|nr:phosphoribosylformylglycinamidine cyclo-ligase [Roseiflexaceae bacterium]